MRFKYILNSLSWMMVLYGGLIFVPCFVALYYREWSAIMPFAGVALVTVIVGLILQRYTLEYQNLNNVKKLLLVQRGFCLRLYLQFLMFFSG